MKAALYTRVSTRDKGQETANQLKQLREFCSAQSWPIVVEYEDHESGGKADRAQFRTMMADAARRRFDVLLFWALDRFSREGIPETHMHLKRLDDAGVRFRSLTEPYFDSCGMFRGAVISIVASVAKQERIRIGERVRAGLMRAMTGGTRSGRPVGRPRVIVRRDHVAELRGQGLSWSQIAKRTGVSIATVRRAFAEHHRATARAEGCQNLPEEAA
jgi:DNA invertase Pin-like site-specific DNA recombinase